MARYLHAASVAAIVAALSTSAEGQVQTTYSYDPLGRLTGVTRVDGSTALEYDPAGNRSQLTLTSGNHYPVANNDALTVPAGQSVSIDPRLNDTDPDNDGLMVAAAAASPTPKGGVSWTPTSVTYAANGGQGSGVDYFTYQISDGRGGTSTAKVKVTITAATTTKPVAANTVASITANYSGGSISYSLPLDFSGGGAPTSVSMTSPPSNGTTSVGATSINFTPTSGWSGQTSLQYTGTNSAGTSAPATVAINVKPVISDASGLTASAGQAKVVSLASYALTSGVTSMSLPNGSSTQKGTASFSGTTLTYTPSANATGADTFAYTATSAGGTSTPANVSFSITCSPPVAGSTSATVAYNSASNVIPLSLGGGAATSVNYVTGSSHGSVQAIGTTMYYTPFSGYYGSDSFTYNATNACGTSNTATGNITVAPPLNRNPTAGADAATIAASVNSLGETYAYFDPRTNDNDPDNDPLTLVSVTAPQHGHTWTNSNNYVSYIPFVGWSGTDYFTYTISDGRGGSAVGNVTITVNPPPPNYAPTANWEVTDPVWQSTTVYVDPTINDTDPDHDTLTIQSLDNFYCAYGVINGVSTCPSNFGSISRNGNMLTFNAPFLSNNGAAGSSYIAVVVWYTINDGHGHTAQSYQTFNVYGPQ